MAPIIRSYRPDDLDALYDVCLRTGHAGEDASDLADDPRLVGHLFAGPYGLFEPELAFVIEDGEGIGGYVLGALDTVRFEERMEQEWLPPLRAKYPDPSGRDEAWGFDTVWRYLIHHPHRTPPEVTATYPSHLHIDLLPRFQGGGNGRRMMDTLLVALRAAGSPGVHFGVSGQNLRAQGFYAHLGFHELSRTDTIVHYAMKL